MYWFLLVSTSQVGECILKELFSFTRLQSQRWIGMSAGNKILILKCQNSGLRLNDSCNLRVLCSEVKTYFTNRNSRHIHDFNAVKKILTKI